MPDNQSTGGLKSNSTLSNRSIFSYVVSREWQETLYENITWLTDKLTGKPFPGKNIPHLRGNFFYGKLPYICEEEGILNILLEAKPLIEKTTSGMCSFWLKNTKVLLVTKPEHICTFKIKCKELIDDEIESFNSFGDNSSILTEGGKIWKEKRSAYNRYLSLSKVDSPLKDIIRNYLYYIKSRKCSNIDIKKLFDDFALKANIKLLMGMSIEPPGQDSRLKKYKNEIVSKLLMAEVLFDVKKLNKKEIEFLEKYFIETVKYFESFSQDTLINEIHRVNSRSKEESVKKDIMPDFNLLLLAGTETISFALQATIYLLSFHPEIKEKLILEIKEKLNSIEFGLDEVNDLNYLDKVIKEVFRLYPPAPFILPRKVKNEINLYGISLKKGDVVFLSPYLTHRLPNIWKDPETFNPERFKQGNKIEKGAYIPFGLGVRVCPGERYAISLIKLFIASIYSNYEINFVRNPSRLSIQSSSAFFYKNPPVVQFDDIKDNKNFLLKRS